MQFNIELYKTKIDNEKLNNTILDMVSVLEKNEDSIIDHLPIKIEPFEFSIDEDSQKAWKKTNKMNDDLNAEECFNILKEKFEIKKDDAKEARKIMAVRYEISSNGYSSTKTVKVAKNISRTSRKRVVGL